ncbi:hypothetical protein PVAP13_3NG140758 [Panicum virgatum]|uniref:Uncharacterized protein n=1 Tax=Panicum virgatum TaxID=38727 RepID=A0A8T0U9T8_PANVG|nr:hypothetical protein PVAP13_3NG140758 [Panicum virgatum]
MGNCGTKPKTSDGDDAPQPAEPRAPAGPAEGEREGEEVPATEGASQAVVAPPPSEEAPTTAAETKEHGEPKEVEAVPKEVSDQDKEEETPATEAAGELPASTPASVA